MVTGLAQVAFAVLNAWFCDSLGKTQSDWSGKGNLLFVEGSFGWQNLIGITGHRPVWLEPTQARVSATIVAQDC